MTSCSIYFLETGFFKDLPGLESDIASSFFPFWGNYCFIDFAFTNFSEESSIKKFIILENRFKHLISLFQTKCRDKINGIFTLENGIRDLYDLIKRDDSDYILLYVISNISIYNSNYLLKILNKNKSAIIKITIDKIPLDYYLVKRKAFLKILQSYIDRLTQEYFLKYLLFDTILHEAIELLVDLPGIVLYQNNSMQMYMGNIWLNENINNSVFLKFLSKTYQENIEKKNSFIGESGFIKNSFISTGVEINGYVENSILFSKVAVHKEAKIIDSVIMSNNRIGQNTIIQNSLIFPFYNDSSNIVTNIGENSIIGGKKTNVKNTIFPNQIKKGLSIIGMNSRIPGGFIMEQGTYIGPNVPYKQLKNRKILKKCSSLYINTKGNDGL